MLRTIEHVDEAQPRGDSRASLRRAQSQWLVVVRVALVLVIVTGVGFFALTGELIDRSAGMEAPVMALATATDQTPHALRSALSQDDTPEPTPRTSPEPTTPPTNTPLRLPNITQATPPTNRLAYMFYITKDNYACAALHLMHHLADTVGYNASRIDLVVLHSPSVSGAMLQRIREHRNARLIPVETMLADATESTWRESLTKLLAFREWGYDRVVYLDADSVPRQSLDHLFELPSAPLYAPRAYWLKQPFFASTLMVIEPNDTRFHEIIEWARARGRAAGFDMDILNAFFKDTVQYLPGDYTVLNSDFRATPDAPNTLYQTTTELKQHTKLVHFSCKPDGSYGKPWSSTNHDVSFVAKKGLDPLFAELFEDYWAFEKRVCS